MPSKEELEHAKIEAETRYFEAATAKCDFELERAKKTALKNDSDDDNNRVLQVYYGINGSTVASAIQTLNKWSRIDPGCEITIVFTSPGGYVLDGLALYDCMRELSARGHRIITKANGYAASMAGILMQAGDHRVIAKHAYFHLHEIQAGVQGGTSEREESEKFAKRLEDSILEILASRSTLTKLQIRNRWKKNNVWLSATEARDLGFVDEIADQ